MRTAGGIPAFQSFSPRFSEFQHAEPPGTRLALQDRDPRRGHSGHAAPACAGERNPTDREHDTDVKAGNLNHALAQTGGEFIAVFDADHVPDRSFLCRTLGYFRDPEVAFVQCPQTFCNLDAYQVRGRRSLRWGEQSLFFRVIQRGKDCWNATMFVGTSAVIRRTALEDIGGIATGTVTEDLHTTIRLQRAGWSSVYHDEALAFGLAAPSLRSYVGQRLRWGQGAMQVWRREGLLLPRGHTPAQRICNLASVLTYFDAWPRLFLYALPGVVLVTGVMPVSTLDLAFLVHFVPYYFLHFWVFEEVARGYDNSLYVEEYNLLRSFTFACSTLALLRSRIPFVARIAHTGPIASGRVGPETFWVADRTPGQVPDTLARFLYSSDLQWRINAISERMRPPVEWLGDMLRGRRPVRVADPG